MVSGPEGFIVMVMVGLIKYCSMGLESTTSTTKEEVPCTVGVPEITPVVDCNTSPAGRLPVYIFQVNGTNPPMEGRVAL